MRQNLGRAGAEGAKWKRRVLMRERISMLCVIFRRVSFYLRVISVRVCEVENSKLCDHHRVHFGNSSSASVCVKFCVRLGNPSCT